jgi:hypothetical protein
MAASLFANATEYITNAITLTRGTVSQITGVGIYVNTNPNQVPTVSQFTMVTLMDGTQASPPPLAIPGEIDVLTKVGAAVPAGPAQGTPPSAPAIVAGDLATLTPGAYQVWILVRTSAEAIIRKVDTLTIT